MNIYIVYEINLWSFRRDDDFTLGNNLFDAVKLTKNADKDKYKYSGYGIGFNNHGIAVYLINVITFRADMRFSVRVDNKKKDI